VSETSLSRLADRSCVPCRGGTPPLAPAEIEPLLARLDGWTVKDAAKISKPYKFRNFVDAVAFVNAITPVAEAEGHHPDLFVKWGEVRVNLSTHKIKGLTESDFIMAAKIDRVREGLSP
jgi:4a-hydroxytetrahydrobiopterin dehydratase